MSIKSIRIQFLFDVSFLLGMTGALQGIFTPDFKHIHNLVLKFVNTSSYQYLGLHLKLFDLYFY